MDIEKQYICLGIIKSGRYKAEPATGDIISYCGKSPRVLQAGIMNDGFVTYKLDLGFNKFFNVYGHNFIYLSEYGSFNPDHKVFHKNKVLSDNRISNLTCLADPEKIDKSYSRIVRLSEEIKRNIVADYRENNLTFIALAKKYDVSRQTISLVCKGK